MQRAEVERREAREGREGRELREGRPREVRGDEWADPWMRAEPAARRRRPPSSDESYTSSRYLLERVLFIEVHGNAQSNAYLFLYSMCKIIL